MVCIGPLEFSRRPNPWKARRRANSSETSPTSNLNRPSPSTPAQPRLQEQQKREMDSQPPPSYSELFYESHVDSQARPPMDPLVAAMWHNQTVTPLHRLPDDILTRIIDMLDNCGVECIRRASRRFPPLCTEIILGRLRTYLPCDDDPDEEAGSYRGPFTWPRFSSMSHKGQAEELLRVVEGRGACRMPEDRPRLLRLLHRDWYCDGCREAEEAPGWGQRVERLRRFMYCSECVSDHPACLFSVSQRLEKPQFRVCIAHEGYLRICAHEQGIIRWSDVLESETKTGPAELLQCKHSSHTFLCAKTRMDGLGLVTSGCGTPMVDYIRPTLETVETWIELRWNAHLMLGREPRPLTASRLRTRLAEVRDNAGRFICPTTAPGMDLPEMRCFDPNNCDCVRFEGSQSIDFVKGGHADPTHGWSFDHKIVPLESSLKCFCAPSIHGKTRLDAIGTYSYGPGETESRTILCHRKEKCVVFRYRRSFLKRTSGGYINPHWYQSLYPESYNLTADREGLGVYWCRQQQCRNYYGRIPGFSRIVLSSEYSRKCHRSFEEVSH